jgi:uncharacterized protein (DUF1499 family)
MMIWKTFALIALVVVLGGVVVLALLGAWSHRAPGVGLVEGQLRPCPDSPNCVCTEATDDQHRMEPLPYEGTAEEALARLKAVLASQPRVRIVSATGTYLHSEWTSRVFCFVDDVEFIVDDERRVIHFRSASRVGRSDLGANRRRMEAFRKAFLAEGSGQ